jgi:hypothetical protein
MGGTETFTRLLNYLDAAFDDFKDNRTGANTRYLVQEAAFSAFSVFFTQSPSFLAYQESMEKNTGNNNARTIFGIHDIPSDNQIRNLLDPTRADVLAPVFIKTLSYLADTKKLEDYRHIGNSFLLILDGTGFFYSEKLHCPGCSVKHHKDGRVSYSHSAITPVIAAPGNSKVISFPPEFIRPQDGCDKEDCENQAAKRWLTKWGEKLHDMNVTILGDDLYSRQPVIESIKEQNCHYILVCKPQSHHWLSEFIANSEFTNGVNKVCIKKWTGKERQTYTYRFQNDVPLRDTKDALHVNWIELVVTNEAGMIIFKNSYITDHLITKENAPMIVEAGRTRWKIENENNNTLKTKGYHLEHNYGHGKENLCEVLFSLIVISFLFHTVLEMFDKRYMLIRKNLPTRSTFFNDIRALTRYICFKDWNDMLLFMLKGLELADPDG